MIGYVEVLRITLKIYQGDPQMTPQCVHFFMVVVVFGWILA